MVLIGQDDLILGLEERIMALNILIVQQMPLWTGGSIFNLLLQFVGMLSFDITTY